MRPFVVSSGQKARRGRVNGDVESRDLRPWTFVNPWSPPLFMFFKQMLISRLSFILTILQPHLHHVTLFVWRTYLFIYYLRSQWVLHIGRQTEARNCLNWYLLILLWWSFALLLFSLLLLFFPLFLCFFFSFASMFLLMSCPSASSAPNS